jgi:hypothetical protein
VSTWGRFLFLYLVAHAFSIISASILSFIHWRVFRCYDAYLNECVRAIYKKVSKSMEPIA